MKPNPKRKCPCPEYGDAECQYCEVYVDFEENKWVKRKRPVEPRKGKE